MSSMIICVPSDIPGGLGARVSPSFENSEVYNFLRIEAKDDSQAIDLYSMRHSCQSGACLDPIDAIARKATTLIVSRISDDFLWRFLKEGTRLFTDATGTVLEAARAYSKGELRAITSGDFSSQAAGK